MLYLPRIKDISEIKPFIKDLNWLSNAEKYINRCKLSNMKHWACFMKLQPNEEQRWEHCVAGKNIDCYLPQILPKHLVGKRFFCKVPEILLLVYQTKNKQNWMDRPFLCRVGRFSWKLWVSWWKINETDSSAKLHFDRCFLPRNSSYYNNTYNDVKMLNEFVTSHLIRIRKAISLGFFSAQNRIRISIKNPKRVKQKQLFIIHLVHFHHQNVCQNQITKKLFLSLWLFF